MRFQTNIFVAPWPQDEAMKLYGCFSLTSTWGCKQIILLLRDLNIRSRGNTFIAPWPQDEVTRKYFSFSVTSTWGRKQILFNLRDQNLWSRTNNFPPHVLQIYRGFFLFFLWSRFHRYMKGFVTDFLVDWWSFCVSTHCARSISFHQQLSYRKHTWCPLELWESGGFLWVCLFHK